MASDGKTVRDIMIKEPLTAEKSRPLLDVVKLMAEKNIGAVIVTDGGKPVGIFSERDLMKKIVAKSLDPAKSVLGDAATMKLTGIKSSSSVETCAREMYKLNMRHFPVSEGGKIVGMVSIRDVMGSLINS